MDKTLIQKLTEIQNELKVKKSRYNSFGKYNFRSAEDILEAIKPLALKHNVSVTTTEKYLGDGVIRSRAIIQDKLNHLKSDAIVAVDENQKGMQRPQKFGTASSYGKKYALGNLFLIDDTQDSDAINKIEKEIKVKLPKLLINTPQYKNALEGMQKGKTINDIKKVYTLTKEIEKQLLNFKIN
tara:strand:+ start:56 stop:604 length:549 start_codon:yes stop_codon:yes gene_type:complete